MTTKKKQNKPAAETSLIRSSAAEYLTFVAAGGDSETSVEIRYEDENIWLTQKMMGLLYDVETHTINYHLKKVFADSELDEKSVIRNFRITAADGKTYDIAATDREILQDAGKVTAEIAQAHAESEFEKYRIIQDRCYVSDFDAEMKKLASGADDEQ